MNHKILRKLIILFINLTVGLGTANSYAHSGGMGEYKEFFRETTDAKIKKIVDKLKEKDEFNYKIFIITADYGHTAMPDQSQMIYTQIKRDEDGNVISQKSWHGDASCKLKLEGFNKDKVLYPELANNNLHIWELATLFQQFGQTEGLKLLVPREI